MRSSILIAAVAVLGACRPSTPSNPSSRSARSARSAGEPTAAPEGEATATGERSTTPAAQDDAGWREVASEDGIVVTSRPSEHSPLPVFRGVGVVEAPLLEVLAVVTDAERHHEWIFACSASALIEQTSDRTGVVYNRTATPWPVPDRDVVLESRIEAIDGEREVRVGFSATEHAQRPPEEGVVRMTYLHGHYHLWAEGPERTRVEYQVDSDPGGRLPTWLATRGTRDMPLETLRDLRVQVLRTRGQHAEQLDKARRAVLGSAESDAR